jgi:hypothetical protein
MKKTKGDINEVMKKVYSKMQKKDLGKEIIKKMPAKVVNDINKKLPNKNFKDILDNAIKLGMCGIQKCQKETLNLAKIKAKKDVQTAAVMTKLLDKKITQEKANIELEKINSKFQKTEDSFKFLECSLKNCTEFMKNQLTFTIGNLNTKFKDNKVKLDKLKTYSTLFNKKDIDMKDVRQFYKEFI